jgi:hypothetical protein
MAIVIVNLYCIIDAIQEPRDMPMIKEGVYNRF